MKFSASIILSLILLTDAASFPPTQNDAAVYPPLYPPLPLPPTSTPPAVNTSLALSHIQSLTSFHTRYFNSASGRSASLWVYDTLSSLSARYPNVNVDIELFNHSWKQPSVIAKISPSTTTIKNGSSSSVIVLGAHIDSVNLYLPFLLRAPGANDNASGVVSLLEAFRLFLHTFTSSSTPSSKGTEKKIGNEVHFHFYAAEESGIRGSYDVFKSYKAKNIDVAAVLVLDMTGTPGGVISVVEDYVDGEFAGWVYGIAGNYFGNTTAGSKKEKNAKDNQNVTVQHAKCGYACSDHASASRFGFPSSLVTGAFQPSSSSYTHSHDASDTPSTISLPSIALHAQLAFIYAKILSQHSFPPLKNRKPRVEKYGDGIYGYILRWCAERAADPLGMGLWIAVLVAWCWYTKVWRDIAEMWVWYVKRGGVLGRVGVVGYIRRAFVGLWRRRWRRGEGYAKVPGE